MSITVVGSVAYDTVTTLFGKSERQLGGSAIYFSLAASKFTNVIPVGVYGEDFLDEDIEILKNNGVDNFKILSLLSALSFSIGIIILIFYYMIQKSSQKEIFGINIPIIKIY